MPQWWSSAAQALKRRPQETPQAYEVRCVCGTMLSGVRTRTHQTPPCPKCGTLAFVLPASVYPLVVVKHAAPAAKPASTGQGRSERAASETATEAAKPQATVAETTVKPREEKPSAETKTSLAALTIKRRRRLGTPLQGVLLAIAVLLGVMVWWVVHVQAVNQAAVVLGEATRLGEAALKENDFTEAALHFGRAAQALDTMGRDDPQARA